MMETSTKYNRYAALQVFVAKAHPSFKSDKVQKKASEIWNTVKSDPTKYKVAMVSLEKSIADQNVKRISMWSKFQKIAQGSSKATKPTSTTTAASERPTESATATVSKSPLKARATSMTEPASSTQSTGAAEPTSASGDNTTAGQELCTEKRYRTPAQDDIAKQIEEKSALIIKLTDVKDLGLATKEILAKLTAAKRELKSSKQKQQYLINDAVRQRKRRMEEKEVRMKLAAESEENAKKLKKFTHDQPGRPPVEDLHILTCI